MDTYTKEREMTKKEAEKYEDMFKEIDGLEVANLEVDLPNINMDESKVESNKEWIKSIRKDAYIDEVLYIMKDMMKK